MNIKIIFTGDEVASRLFLKLHLTKFTPFKKVYLGINILAVVIACLFLIFNPNRPYWIIISLFALVMPFFYISQRNSLVDKSVNKRATYDQIMVFKPNFITHSYANTENLYEYKQITKFVETVDYIFLYINETKAMIVPKRQIPQDEMGELINHLHQKIDDSKYKYYKVKK